MAAVWLAMSVAGLWFVLYYGSGVPSGDSVHLLPYLTGEEPVTSAWLWRPHNEHRVPFSKLLLYVLVRPTESFQTALVFEVVVLSVLSGGLILAARRMRGFTRAADAFFPLVLLQWGNAVNLLHSFQVALMVPTAVLAALWAAILLGRMPPTAKGTWGLGLAAISMPLFSGSGFVQLLPIAAWLGLTGAWLLARKRLAPGGVALGLGLGALLLCGVYVPWSRTGPPASVGVGNALVVSGELLGTALGPLPNAGRPFVVAFVLVVVLSTAGLLIRTARKPEERVRALGGLACWTATVLLSFAIGWQRGSADAARYVLLTTPLLTGAYLAWYRFAPPRTAGFVGAALALAAALLVPFHVQTGRMYGRANRSWTRALERDAARVLSPWELAWRYADAFHQRPERYAERLVMLRRVGWPPYGGAAWANRGDADLGIHWPFSMFRTQPEGGRFDRPIAPDTVPDGPVLVVHADSELRFRVDGAKSVTARFGIHPDAYEQAGTAVRFAIELEDGQGCTSVLFERELDVGSPDERGVHTASVSLPPGATGVVRLVTQRRSDHELAWAFWTAVELR